MKDSLNVSCTWTVKEKRNGIYIPVLTRKNIFTNTGLTLLASAVSGGYVPPIYLSMDSSYTYLTATYAAGVTSIQTNTAIDQTGDTQLVLSAGLATQETVTFTGRTGTGPYTYTLSSPTANAHNAGDWVARQPTVNDTISTIVSPIQYDSVNFPNLWPPSASGYSIGNGQWTIQFYLTLTQAVAVIMTIGLVDSQTIGQGNLHNHVVLGYDHTQQATDIEIDGNLTLTNS
jgi:hypothetical protein